MTTNFWCNPQWLSLLLRLYSQRSSKRIWGLVWASGRKCREVHNILSTNQTRKWNGMTITYKIKFTGSIRFMYSSMWTLANSLSEGIHKKQCKYCKSGHEYGAAQENTLTFKGEECNKKDLVWQRSSQQIQKHAQFLWWRSR